MTFALPALLGLLPLALAPIAVHLLYKRRRATIDFPSLRLLRNVELRLSPRRKLREILLLLARCLFVAMLVLAVARPVSSGSTGSSSTPVDHVIVIDNTASMKMAGDGATAIQVAKKRVTEVLDSLGSHDRAALLPMVEPADWSAAALTNDLARLRQALESLPGSDASADVGQVVERALEIVRGGSTARRELIVVSDFRGPAAGDDATERALARRGSRTGVLLVDCAFELTRPDVALELLEVDPPAPLVGRPVTVRVRLTNGSDDELVRGVGIELAGTPLETRNITLPGGGSAVASLRILGGGQVGWTPGRVTLSEDAYRGNDRSAFVLRVRDRLRVLLVDPALDEAAPDPEASGRFLARLLDPSGDGRLSGIEVRRVRADDVRGEIPGDVHAVLVCGFDAAEGVGALTLKHFAETGGFVAVFAEPTDRSSSAGLNWLAGRPKALRRDMDPPGRVRPPRADEDPEAERALRDLTVRAETHMNVRPDARTLLQFGPTEPALVVGPVGEGHSMAAGFGLSPAWGSFTFHPWIVALLHRVVARYAAPPSIVRATAGANVQVPAYGAGPAHVTRDDVALGEIQPVDSDAHAGPVYDLGRVLRAGLFAFDAETDTDFQRYVAVNPDPRESALARPAADLVAERYGGARLVDPDEELGPLLVARRAGREFVATFLLLALLFALAEALLGGRLPKRRAATPEEASSDASARARSRRPRRRPSAPPRRVS